MTRLRALVNIWHKVISENIETINWTFARLANQLIPRSALLAVERTDAVASTVARLHA
jgi:hypothetical protein